MNGKMEKEMIKNKVFFLVGVALLFMGGALFGWDLATRRFLFSLIPLSCVVSLSFGLKFNKESYHFLKEIERLEIACTIMELEESLDDKSSPS